MKRSTLAKRIGKVVLDTCQIPRLNKQGGFIRYTKSINLRNKHYVKGDIVTRRIKSMKEFRNYYKPFLASVRDHVISDMVQRKEDSNIDEQKANEANDNTNNKVVNELNMNNNNL